MRRMNVIMSRDREDDVSAGTAGGAGAGKYECDSCRAEFPNKTSADRHMLFCRTLAGIRRGGGGGAGAGVSTTIHNGRSGVDDALMPTQREMFILIQELAAKYNKVKDELDVMKQWAKMVGRRIGGVGAGGGGGAAAAGVLEFTSITRQKRQNMEATLNEEDDEMIASAASIGAESPIQLRPSFTEWLSSSSSSLILNETDLNVVFHEDLVAGITAALLRILAEYTAESGKSHLVPFKLADVKQGAFYIYDAPFHVGPVPDLPAPATRRWRAIEPCEFQLLMNTIHKLLFKEFKKWQDRNWEAQHQMTKQRQKAASSYHNVMSSIQGSAAAVSCDGMYSMPGSVVASSSSSSAVSDDEPEPVTDTVLSEDFATLYNKYADKMLGGALSNDTILTRVRAKLWKDMKAWRL